MGLLTDFLIISSFLAVIQADEISKIQSMFNSMISSSSGTSSFFSRLFSSDGHLSIQDFERSVGMSTVELEGTANELRDAETGKYFEGDIMVPAADVMHNALRAPDKKWPSAQVAYSLASGYTSSERAIIASAFSEYASKTCIQFKPRNRERDYLYIFKGEGCYSSVGRNGGRQELSLGRGCLHKGIVIHELMHAVGFLHEQSRTDRDKYVQVMWDNIKFGMDSQFKKYSQQMIDHLGQPYDYDSIMHYGRGYFSKNDRDTLVPIRRSATIGQRKGLSKIDIKKLNLMYKCSPTSKTSKPKPRPTSTNRPTSTRCSDESVFCSSFVPFGYCSSRQIAEMCQESCGKCGSGGGSKSSCYDAAGNALCGQVRSQGLCTNRSFAFIARSNCAKSCGIC